MATYTGVQFFRGHGVCSVADVGFHELQLAMSLHRQWHQDIVSLNASHTFSVEVAGKKILSRYLHGMRSVRDSIASQLITYDIDAMIVSILILWMVSLFVPSFVLLQMPNSLQ